jgi:hypothetical protein
VRTSQHHRRLTALGIGRPGVVLLLSLALAPARAAAQRAADPGLAPHDGQRDFDFEIGTWVMHRRRLVHPAGGVATWAESDGDLHLVRKIWDGHATLAELELMSPAPHFAGSILHLYNPQTRQWSLFWASAADATVAAPMVGEFKDGRGEFYGVDTVRGASVFARVVYSDITPTAFRTEQATSSDGGRTWETNSIDTYRRTSQ